MQRARIAAITVAALLAVTASALAAWWMTGRSRRHAEIASDRGGAGAGEVEIEIPRAAGPTSVAQLDTIAALDPGKIADAGAPSEVAEPAPSEPAPSKPAPPPTPTRRRPHSL